MNADSFVYLTPTKYTLESKLPPEIMLSFERPCDTRFVKVIRHESVDPDTKETTIALGVLLKRLNTAGVCQLPVTETVSAGHAYSGRPHAIEFISIGAAGAKAITKKFDEVDQARPSLHGSNKGVPCPLDVVPGRSIGQLELGQDFEQVKALGMKIKKVRNIERIYVVGPYSVAFNEQNKVSSVEAELGDLPLCVKYQGKKINPATSIKTLRGMFPECAKKEVRMGGNSVACQGITLTEGGWGGSQKTVGLTLQK